ncbi:MAG: Crp/Fnr family transcriptional regulator, partial [Rubrimonas sp.]
MIPLEQELRRAAPDWPSELCAAVAARGRRVRFADGDALFGPGDAAAAFLAPLSGAVRVEHAGSAGRSMVLYRVGPGDSCVVTAACMLSGAPYQAWGVAEGGLEAVALSPADFRALIEAPPVRREAAGRVVAALAAELGLGDLVTRF